MDPFARYLKQDTFDTELKQIEESEDIDSKIKFCKEYLEANGMMVLNPKEIPDIGKRGNRVTGPVSVYRDIQYRSNYTGTILYDKSVDKIKYELMDKLMERGLVSIDLTKHDDFFGTLRASIEIV